MNARIAGYEVDALFREQRVIVELDGYEFHGTRQAFEKDRERDAATLAAGSGTVRITWERLTETPETGGRPPERDPRRPFVTYELLTTLSNSLARFHSRAPFASKAPGQLKEWELCRHFPSASLSSAAQSWPSRHLPAAR